MWLVLRWTILDGPIRYNKDIIPVVMKNPRFDSNVEHVGNVAKGMAIDIGMNA